MNTANTRSIVVSVVTFLLWLATVVLAFWNVYALWQLYGILYARGATSAGPGNEAAALFGNVLMLFLGLAAIAFIILSGEYHRRYMGKPRSWRVFAVTLVVQIAVSLIYAVLEAL